MDLDLYVSSKIVDTVGDINISSYRNDTLQFLGGGGYKQRYYIPISLSWLMRISLWQDHLKAMSTCGNCININIYINMVLCQTVASVLFHGFEKIDKAFPIL